MKYVNVFILEYFVYVFTEDFKLDEHHHHIVVEKFLPDKKKPYKNTLTHTFVRINWGFCILQIIEFRSYLNDKKKLFLPQI